MPNAISPVQDVSTRRVGNMACAVSESPLWCARRGHWVWVDILARTIWRFEPATGAMRAWQTAEMVAGIAFDQKGDLIAGMESEIFHLRLPGEGAMVEARRLAAPSENMAGMHFNDGRCDRQGRFWSGTLAQDGTRAPAVGKLYRYSADRSANTNTTPGNRKGGLSNIVEKAMGSIVKSGSSAISGGGAGAGRKTDP